MNTAKAIASIADSKDVTNGALLLFRIGDFYETFHGDAMTVAAECGLTVTSCIGDEGREPMAGFPYYQLDRYLAALIALGHRCAVIEDA